MNDIISRLKALAGFKAKTPPYWLVSPFYVVSLERSKLLMPTACPVSPPIPAQSITRGALSHPLSGQHPHGLGG